MAIARLTVFRVQCEPGASRTSVGLVGSFIALCSEYVSGNYFSTLSIGLYAGRPLVPSDDKSGAAPVLVLSYATWQSDFAGDQRIVGTTIYVQTHLWCQKRLLREESGQLARTLGSFGVAITSNKVNRRQGPR